MFLMWAALYSNRSTSFGPVGMAIGFDRQRGQALPCIPSHDKLGRNVNVTAISLSNSNGTDRSPTFNFAWQGE